MQTAFQTELSTVAIKKIAVPPKEPKQPAAELIPLSFAQQRLWFFSQLERDSPLYNIPTAIQLAGELNIGALQRSLNVIIERHEALRTNFISEAGNPVQIIRPQAKLEITIFDLTSRAPKQREDEIQKLIVAESQKPFDLASDLLLRASLIRIEAREHILIINMHHIVSDEWSLQVLFRELAALYQGLVAGDSYLLPELPIQYADYALWQRECLHGEILDREISYWKNQLGKDFSPLELPADHPRPAIQTYKGASRSLSLSKNILNSITDLSRREGVTLFMSLVAAFKALLHRSTGQEQITIGSPISGRNKIETENLIGFFVNTLVLRTNVSDEISFRELLARVREVTLGAYAHQELPFEKLVEELQPRRGAGNLSFIQVMFALQNVSANELQLPGLEVKFLDVESQTSKFDLTFVVRESSDGLTLVAEYNTDLFEGETVERMLNQYGHLLESIAENPEQKISRLNLLSEAERHRLLIDWNKTESVYPRDKSIAQLFEAQVRKSPDAVALIYGERQLTYRELDERANQLANHLRKLGVGPDVLVAICVERSIEMIIGFLGILKAGGAYAPLDADYPAERLAFMIEDAQSPVLLTQERLAARFDQQKSKRLCLDSDWETIAREPKSAPGVEVDSENLAYVVYTSGSTGQPKGVAVPHRAINRLVFNTNYIQLDSSDRIAQASNSSFDAATFEIWGALLHGATLIGFSKEEILSPGEFAEQIERQKISAIFLTTALFNQIAENAPRAFHSVKNVLFGGEAVDPKWVKEILAQGPPQRLLHVYGPTESTTFASWFEIKNVPENATTIPIGKPLSNTTCYVLDRNLQPVSAGVPGELHIGGDGLARGYFNRPELNAAKFIPNPFRSEPNSLLYKTGDLVRYLPDGNIEFIGRIDHQVKIRGFRIELQEIETVLKQHAFVRDAIVLAREETGDKRLVAYFVPSKTLVPTNDDLRTFLKQKLPDYMVPSTFIALDEFPLNANGKVDRHTLPVPGAALVHAEESRSTPPTFLEKKLKEIWEEVIGRKPIDVRENFFDLGGHSLLAVRLFARIEKVLGKKLPLALLFQSPTIEQLAKSISGDMVSASDSCVIEIQPKGSRPPIFWLHTLGGGGGGGVLRYQKLAQLLGPDQPSYGLVAPQEPFEQMEKMAAHYIQEMRTVQPVGPYHLSGYCFGGVVAFEIAQQLRAAGDEVGLLAVLDSSPANVADARTLSQNALHLFTSLPKRVERFFHQEPAQMFAGLKRKSKQIERMLSALIRHDRSVASRIALEDVIDMAHYPAGYQRYAEVHWKALLNYFPKLYPGKIVLFETTKSLGHSPIEPVWKSLAGGGVEVKRIPSTHEQMLDDPYVRMVAAELQESLEHCHSYGTKSSCPA